MFLLLEDCLVFAGDSEGVWDRAWTVGGRKRGRGWRYRDERGYRFPGGGWWGIDDRIASTPAEPITRLNLHSPLIPSHPFFSLSYENSHADPSHYFPPHYHLKKKNILCITLISVIQYCWIRTRFKNRKNLWKALHEISL